MKKRTIIKITADHYGTLAHEEFLDTVSCIVNNGIDCFCEVQNSRIINVVEEQKNYISHKEVYENKTVVEARGYSQGDWQTYILYHNEKEGSNDLELLVSELERSFTHQNDYIVEKFEQIEVDGKTFNADPHDYTHFSIRDIEFPNSSDVIGEYLEIYGKDFDEYIIEIE
jgi:hypothetical protein